MKLTNKQVEILLKRMQEIAEAVVDDNQSRGSDYCGMDLYRLVRSGEAITEFTKELNVATE